MSVVAVVFVNVDINCFLFFYKVFQGETVVDPVVQVLGYKGVVSDGQERCTCYVVLPVPVLVLVLVLVLSDGQERCEWTT